MLEFFGIPRWVIKGEGEERGTHEEAVGVVGDDTRFTLNLIRLRELPIKTHR